jgi:4-hydroxy-tetrahydrodipicolinate synthase
MSTSLRSFEGAMTALVTPFRDGKVDDKALAELVEDQIAAGIDALVPAGTTGETATLSMEEHVHVVAQVVKQARKRVPIIAGAGANSTAKAIELSRAVQKAGADALLHVTPYYNRPTQEGLYRHFKAIVDALEASPLPIILYNVPSRTSCDMMADTVIRLAELPTIVGIKEATGLPVRATQILLGTRRRPGFTVIAGDDATMLPLYAVGARGVISVLSNIAPRWVAEMWDLVVAGDWARAREIHDKALPLVELLFAETSPMPLKAALALAGKMSDEMRAPLFPTSGALREKLAAALKSLGLT